MRLVEGVAMPNDSRDPRAESLPLLLPWGLPGTEAREDPRDAALLWLTGGAALVLWTAVALLLSSA
jgi:hypothetical protein